MTKWEYGYATFDGFAFRDYQSMGGDMGSPSDFPTFLYCAGRSGWEFCGTLPEPRLRFEEWQGQRNLLMIFKRATKHLPAGPFVPQVDG
jgi:hypothetical protein